MHEIGSPQQVVYAFCLTVDFPWSVAAECQNFKYFPYQEEARVCSIPWQQKQRASSLEHGTCRKDANVKQTLCLVLFCFVFVFCFLFCFIVSFRVSIVNSSCTTWVCFLCFQYNFPKYGELFADTTKLFSHSSPYFGFKKPNTKNIWKFTNIAIKILYVWWNIHRGKTVLIFSNSTCCGINFLSFEFHVQLSLLL